MSMQNNNIDKSSLFIQEILKFLNHPNYKEAAKYSSLVNKNNNYNGWIKRTNDDLSLVLSNYHEINQKLSLIPICYHLKLQLNNRNNYTLFIHNQYYFQLHRSCISILLSQI